MTMTHEIHVHRDQNKSMAPNLWKKAVISVVCRKGDETNSKECRPLVVFPQLYKLFSTMLCDWLLVVLHRSQSAELAGFGKTFRSTGQTSRRHFDSTASWWKTCRRRWCPRQGELSWQDACMRRRSQSWPWLARSTTPSRSCYRSSLHAVPGGWRDPSSVATASASDPLVDPIKRRGGFQLTNSLENILKEESIRTDIGYGFGGNRSGAKVMAMRAEGPREMVTFLKRVRQAGAKVVRFVKISAFRCLIHGSDATGMPFADLNEGRLKALKIRRGKRYRCWTSCMKMLGLIVQLWHLAWVEPWFLEFAEACNKPQKFASSVASMMRFV